MHSILIIGAGRSATVLISYLLRAAETENWEVTVGDISLDLARQKIAGRKSGRAIRFDVNDVLQREQEIKKADIVVSMLPAALHLTVAKDCLALGRHLLTASYLSKEIAAMDGEAKAKGLL